MPRRMLSRNVGSLARFFSAALPPASAQLGISTEKAVELAVYGYWSCMTSVPAWRAESAMWSVTVLFPHISRPIAL